jgi:small GTP-binding protein
MNAANRLKVCVVGDVHVGKTTFISSWVNDGLDENSFTSSIADQMYKKKWTPKSTDQEIDVFLVDTAGQERFMNVTTSSYRSAKGIFVLFDVSNRNSFENVAFWLQEIKKYGDLSIPVFLVANKCDLESTVTVEELEEFAKKESIFLKYCSSLIPQQVDGVFQESLESIILIRNSITKSASSRNVINTINETSKSTKKRQECSCNVL